MEEKDMQRKYLQMQLMKQQLNGLLEEKSILDEKRSEIMISIEATKKLGSIGKGQEIWAPLGSAAFARSDIKDTEKVMIGIGAGVVVERNKDDAVGILEQRLGELDELDHTMTAEINKFSDQITNIEIELQKAAQQENK